MRLPLLLIFLIGTALAAPMASAVTLNIALDGLIASGLGDCTPSGPGQCNGDPPVPPVEINQISGHWGYGLPFDQVRLSNATLGPIEMQLPGSITIPISPDFAFLAGGTGGGSAGPDPEGCPEPGAGGVVSTVNFTRYITVNGVQHTFQQSGTIRAGWCLDVFTLNSASVAIDTGQGILTVNVDGAAPVVSEGPTTVSLTSPLSGTTYAAPNVPLSATAAVTIGAVDQVEFYRGGTLVATVLSPPYTATDTGVAAGTYSYTAMAYNSQDPNFVPLVSVAASVTVTGSVTQQINYIHTDHLNTPRLITNQAQQAVWRWDHAEPFGTYPASDNPSGLGAFEFNLRFPGQYFDKETNTHYNYYRDYDPSIGRYVESDPIGLRGGVNTYAYVKNNPLSWIDTDALQTLSREGRERPSDPSRDRPGSDTSMPKLPAPQPPDTDRTPPSILDLVRGKADPSECRDNAGIAGGIVGACILGSLGGRGGPVGMGLGALGGAMGGLIIGNAVGDAICLPIPKPSK